MATHSVILDSTILAPLSAIPPGLEKEIDPREEYAALMGIIDESREQSSLCRSTDPQVRTRQIEDALGKLKDMFRDQPSLEDDARANRDRDKW